MNVLVGVFVVGDSKMSRRDFRCLSLCICPRYSPLFYLLRQREAGFNAQAERLAPLFGGVFQQCDQIGQYFATLAIFSTFWQ